MIRTTTWSFHPVNDVVQDMRSSEGYGGLLEYAPIGADISRIAPGAPDVTVSDATGRSADVKSRDVTLGDVTWRVDAWSAQQKSIYVVTPEPLELNLKLLAYPAWRVTVNGKPEAFDAAPGTGEIEVRVPAGADRVRVVWTRTWDRTAGGHHLIGVDHSVLADSVFREEDVLAAGELAAGERRGRERSITRGSSCLDFGEARVSAVHCFPTSV